MGRWTYGGEPVHVTWQRRAGRITLKKAARDRWTLTLPLGVDAQTGAQYLTGYVPRQAGEPMTQQALTEVLADLAERWLPRFDAADVTIAVVPLPGRWGRCLYGQRRIELNTDCAWLAREHIEELLVHELCHLRCHDHSPAFWLELTRMLPDWAAREGEVRSMAVPGKGADRG